MLDTQLINYIETKAYPFHMPGHKRHSLGISDMYSLDITEITDFDDLHDPQLGIKEIEDRLADLYFCAKSWLLVNGSTVGVLSAIHAMTKENDHILIARNCHRSVYHTAMMHRLNVSYVYPEINEQGIADRVMPEDIKRELSNNPDIKLVVVTSPTYEGIVSDIESISKIVHEHNALLFVDSAHGAHLGFCDSFPKAATFQGADLVVTSLHKSLPFLTQTACLLMPSYNENISERIREYLSYFETSSPSYVLMAAAARGIKFMEKEKDELFSDLYKNLSVFYKNVKKYSNICLFTNNRHDMTKIVILTDNYPGGGINLAKDLREIYNIELEMSSFSYCIALASIMDTKEGFDLLERGLIELGKNVDNNLKGKKKYFTMPGMGKRVMSITKAMDSNRKSIPIKESVGKITAGFIGMYPPGTVLVAPGEQIEKQHVDIICEALEQGYHIRGLQKGNIPVVIE